MKKIDIYAYKQDDYNFSKKGKDFFDFLDKICLLKNIKTCNVLLKPNLIKPLKKGNVSITNTDLILAVAKYFIEKGNKVSIGDSPAFGSAKNVCRKAEIIKECEKNNINIIELSSPIKKSIMINNKKINIHISKKLFDFDKVINIPKLKAHCQIGITAAVKNTYGYIPGKEKAVIHFLAKNSYEYFCEKIIAAHLARKPDFNILDAIDIMDKNGPTLGEKLNIGYIFACEDAFALDDAVCEIFDLKNKYIPLNNISDSLGLIPLWDITGNIDINKQIHLPKNYVPVSFTVKQLIKSMYNHIKDLV